MSLPITTQLTSIEKKTILQNMIRLADHHRKHCDGETCNIILSYIPELLRRAEIEVSKKDAERFW